MGYQNKGTAAHDRVRAVDLPIPEIKAPPGVKVRSVDILEEFEKYREVQSSVFKHCELMTREHASIYSSASFYREDLDFIVETEDGDFAAFCTIRVDPSSGIAEFEPVGTHPKYRKKGLGKAMLTHALRQAEKIKPSFMCIPGANPSAAASKLYESIGFRVDARIIQWEKPLE